MMRMGVLFALVVLSGRGCGPELLIEVSEGRAFVHATGV